MTPQNRLSIPQGLALKDLGLNRWTSVIWDGNSVLIASGIKNNSMLSEGWCTLNQIYDAFDFLREQKVYLKSCLNAGKILELVDFSDEIIFRIFSSVLGLNVTSAEFMHMCSWEIMETVFAFTSSLLQIFRKIY